MAPTTIMLRSWTPPLALRGSDSADGSGNQVDNDAGASGSSTGTIGISHGAMIAIIIVVVIVAVFGIASSVLFYIAKKREWKVRETIRKSARKVVTALTPRRSEFPKSVKEGGSSRSRGRVRLDDVPPTPRLPLDLEKSLGKTENNRSKSGRK